MLYTTLALRGNGIEVVHDTYFDTLKVRPKNMTDFRVRAEERKINVRYFDSSYVGIALDETVLPADIHDILYLFDISLATVGWVYFEMCVGMRYGIYLILFI